MAQAQISSKAKAKLYPKKRDTCGLCEFTLPNQPVLTCERCDTDIHLKCADLSIPEALLIKTFYCGDCINNHKMRLEWEPTPSNSQENSATQESEISTQIDNPRGPEGQENQEPQPPQPGTSRQEHREYRVSKILDIREEEEEAYYKLKWSNGEKTWEPESNCQGCIWIINLFREKRGLGPAKTPDLYGAEENCTVNTNNWVSIDQMIGAINQFDRVKDGLPGVVKFGPSNVSPLIQLLGIGNHVYVLYRSGDGQFYVADGTNSFLEDEFIQAQVEELTGILPIGIKFVGQNANDHCASSAVMIALEFRRTFSVQQKPSVLKAERTTLRPSQESFPQGPQPNPRLNIRIQEPGARYLPKMRKDIQQTEPPPIHLPCHATWHGLIKQRISLKMDGGLQT